MKTYTGTFLKMNGEQRTMVFARLKDLPSGFLEERINGKGKERKLAEGMETVWDVENEGFRLFNWNTVVGEVKEKINNNTKDG